MKFVNIYLLQSGVGVMVGVAVSVGVAVGVEVGILTVTPLKQPSSNSRSTVWSPSKPIYRGINRAI